MNQTSGYFDNNRSFSCHMISTDLKSEGRNALLGHLTTAVSANAVYILIALVLNLIVNAALPDHGVVSAILAEVFTILIGIFSGVFAYGLNSIYMNLQYGQEARFSDLFVGLHENQDKIIRIEAVLVAIRSICSLPAVIAAYTATGQTGTVIIWLLAAAGVAADFYFSLVFSQSLYILLDYPDMNSMDVLKRSRRLMKGKKRCLLYVELSFLPLWLLTLVSFGIAGLWVFAYVQSTEAAFYRRMMEGKI